MIFETTILIKKKSKYKTDINVSLKPHKYFILE